jgi:hypothetical protein
MAARLRFLMVLAIVASGSWARPAAASGQCSGGLKGAFYFRADSDPGARVGPHPDVMVRLGDANDKLIFRRDRGYLPVWYTDLLGDEGLTERLSRSGCDNVVNEYSRVRIIETSGARAIVHWRYLRNCSSVVMTGWIDEYFTVYPDGLCMRTVKDAAGTTYSQWQSGTPDIYSMQLLSTGISSVPASWLDPPALWITSGSYSDEGYNSQRRCYELQCNVTGDPTALSCVLDTTGGKLVHNPVIVLKNWGDAEATVSVDGQGFSNCCIGYADDMYGDDLVVWLDIETPNSVDISIAPSGGSGEFVNRAPPPDFGYDFDADVPPLPMGSPEPGPFGAYYTNLKFNNRFDEYWRVGDHADVVVQFDDNTLTGYRIPVKPRIPTGMAHSSSSVVRVNGAVTAAAPSRCRSGIAGMHMPASFPAMRPALLFNGVMLPVTRTTILSETAAGMYGVTGMRSTLRYIPMPSVFARSLHTARARAAAIWKVLILNTMKPFQLRIRARFRRTIYTGMHFRPRITMGIRGIGLLKTAMVVQ